ncbi:MAG TPA: M56 family metallopeptidase, partial [Candidatus Angelobacter sp.]|nr:M56 family metallopeptidase [Candidatus Angelobacter sp.]
MWFVLQLFPRKDSRTSFAVWFSTLLATAILPLFSLHSGSNAAGTAGPQAVVTISSSWAWYVFLGWAIVALAGLARVALATLQVRRLRADAIAVDMESLDPALQTLVAEFQQSRPVTLMVSNQLEVPTAIGFRKPAIILPAWLMESMPAEELKYILLHELAHLARRDDWTNLAQKVLKALFFFLPSVWWIERKLSLDREMACDDAVLAHSGTPRGYAECLAHVAERSFLRRQIALAQAAVGRVRQLTTRVAMILDPNRPPTTRLWKPAIPVVIFLAGLSALPASFTPSLVNFADDEPAMQQKQPVLSTQLPSAVDGQIADMPMAKPASLNTNNVSGQAVHAVEASLRTDRANVVPRLAKSARSLKRNSVRQRLALVHKSVPVATLTTIASNQLPDLQPEYVTVREELVLIVTQQTPSGEQQSWQMHVVEVSVQP